MSRCVSCCFTPLVILDFLCSSSSLFIQFLFSLLAPFLYFVLLNKYSIIHYLPACLFLHMGPSASTNRDSSFLRMQDKLRSLYKTTRVLGPWYTNKRRVRIKNVSSRTRSLPAVARSVTLLFHSVRMPVISPAQVSEASHPHYGIGRIDVACLPPSRPRGEADARSRRGSASMWRWVIWNVGEAAAILKKTFWKQPCDGAKWLWLVHAKRFPFTNTKIHLDEHSAEQGNVYRHNNPD